MHLHSPVFYSYSWGWCHMCSQPIVLPSKHNVNLNPVGRRKKILEREWKPFRFRSHLLALLMFSGIFHIRRLALHADLCFVDCLAVFIAFNSWSGWKKKEKGSGISLYLESILKWVHVRIENNNASWIYLPWLMQNHQKFIRSNIQTVRVNAATSHL